MYEFKIVEEEAKKVWEKQEKEIEKALQNDSKKPLFSFLEGPPTANAPPGLHHLEVRTFKDIICKYKFMQGFSVPRKGGWDCHGLPIEVQVEKTLGLKDKKDIVSYGIDKFIEKAKNSVFSNIKEWNTSTEELGYWIDLKNPYVTLENNYIESVWWSLKELYNKKLLYESYKVVPFCPRCGTPLSSHEVAQGYKDVQDESIYIAFKIKQKAEPLATSSKFGQSRSKKNSYILAWTTTPWTLPGNVALAVGKNIDYVKIKLDDGDELILGKERLSVIKGEYKIIKELKGKDLEGIEYEPLYNIKETQNKNSHKIVIGDFVNTDDGTGIVHTAVMYGEDDYNLGMKLKLPAVHTVGEDGKFNELVPKLKGKFIKDAEREIIEDLKKRGQLFRIEKVIHSYPFCWRCDSILMYYAINSWFIKVSKVKEKLVELNNKINWEPDHIKEGRFGKWLEGAKDWAISRFKFWGTPLPIWRCECGEEKIIGSIEELKKESKKIPGGKIDLHKPWIDEVKLKCKCGEEMKRIPDVIDCWYDSGAASFAQFHYPFENKEEFEKRFPYDFISEAIDQTRGWFYTLHVISTILFGKPAYKNVICAGHIVDEKGEKMSKSKGNVINPKEMMNQSGVDAIRLQFCTTDAGNFKRFSFNLMNESVIPFLSVLYNTSRYYTQLVDKKLKSKIEDKWILSRLNSTIEKVTKELDNFKIDRAFLEIQNFVLNDLSRKYIRMTRDREDTKEIVGECLEKVSLMIAPFAPYISEYTFNNFSKESVHLSNWPKCEKKNVDEKLEGKFKIVLEIIEKGLSQRDKIQIGLKWPLSKAIIHCKDNSIKDLEELMKGQLNVKKIELKIKEDNETTVELDTNMTPELEAEGYAREISRQVQAFRKELGLNKKNKVKTIIKTDESLKKILEKQKELIKERTNSEKLEIVTTLKETFKNKTDFKVKDKRGEIVIIEKISL